MVRNSRLPNAAHAGPPPRSEALGHGSRTANGYALPAALLVLLLVAVALALLAAAIALRQRDLREDATRIHLVAMADAGLAEVLGELTADPAFTGFAEAPYDRGTIASEVGYTGSGRRTVLVRAQIGQLGRSVSAEVVLRDGRPTVERWAVVTSGDGGDAGTRN